MPEPGEAQLPPKPDNIVNTSPSSGDDMRTSESDQNFHLMDGYELVKKEQDFNVLTEGHVVGLLHIYPGTVQYTSAEGKIYFADIDTESNIPNSDTTSSLPVNISAIAQDIRRTRAEANQNKSDEQQQKRKTTSLIEVDYRSDPRKRYELSDEFREINSFADLLKQVFIDRYGNLSVHDIGTGHGEFALEIAKKAKSFGISKITASDLNLYLLEELRPELENAGVTILNLDVNNAPVDERYDIVTLNAPQATGKHAYVGVAMIYALSLLKETGIVILRLNEASDDIYYDPRWNVSSEYPIIHFKELMGLPNSTYTRSFQPGGSASVYVILKRE